MCRPRRSACSKPLRYSIVWYMQDRKPKTTVSRGRARDPSIDARVLKAAARHLAAYGYEAMSVAAVAEEAGTTRQALYRRWPGKAELSAAAMAALPHQATRADTADPLADLVAEPADLPRGGARPWRPSPARPQP